MVHKCLSHFHNRLGLGICGLDFLSILLDLPLTRETEQFCKTSIFEWIKLTQTPILLKYQMTFFSGIVNFIIQEFKFLQNCSFFVTWFLWWEVNLRGFKGKIMQKFPTWVATKTDSHCVHSCRRQIKCKKGQKKPFYDSHILMIFSVRAWTCNNRRKNNRKKVS